MQFFSKNVYVGMLFLTIYLLEANCSRIFSPWIDFKNRKPGEFADQKYVTTAVKSIVNNEVDENLLPTEWPRSKNRFLTSPKLIILSHINYAVAQLVKEDYIEKSGIASLLIYGEKGIGKSSVLTLAVMGIWMCFDNVIPIYLEYDNRAKKFLAPSEALSMALGLKCVPDLDECLKELKKRNLFAVIIADEIEQVYTGVNCPMKRRWILDELGALGGQTTGRVYTYLCGSSSLIPVLISKNAVHNDQLRKEFPFISKAPNLNGSKFAGVRIHRGLHVSGDLEIIKRVYHLNDEAADLLYYLCGSNLRVVDRVINAMNITDKNSQVDVTVIRNLCDTIGKWDQRATKTREENAPLINGLLDKLVEVNYEIVKRASKDSSQASKIDWIRSLRSISNEEILTVCSERGIENPQYTVNLLVDKGYFSAPPQLDYLLPSKPSDLVDHLPLYKTSFQKIIIFINSLLPSAARFSAKWVSNEVAAGLRDKIINLAAEAMKKYNG